jgi:ferrochelatase
VHRALGIILAPHRTEASWDRYISAVYAARATLGVGAPSIVWADQWFDHPLFIDAMASRTRDALATLDSRDDVPVVFTAHSIPREMADASPYVRQLEISCRLVAAAVGAAEYTLAYQSRSGNPRDPWLEPDVNDVLRTLGSRGARQVVVVPIGFVCDHVEVLYDLDVEARATAEAVGVQLQRAGTANDHPAFIRMLAEVVRTHCGGA